MPKRRGSEPNRLAMRQDREIVVQAEFLEDLHVRIETDRRIALRTIQLMEAVTRDPFDGIGKPEPLKHLGPGTWSRRINQEHRLVYLVCESRIDFLQSRYRY